MSRLRRIDEEERRDPDRRDVYDAEGYAWCPTCRDEGRHTFTPYPVCERCHNMFSPHKAELPHWDDRGRTVN